MLMHGSPACTHVPVCTAGQNLIFSTGRGCHDAMIRSNPLFRLVGPNSSRERLGQRHIAHFTTICLHTRATSCRGDVHLSDRLTKPDTCAGGRAPSSPMIFHIPSSFFLLRVVPLFSFLVHCCQIFPLGAAVTGLTHS